MAELPIKKEWIFLIVAIVVAVVANLGVYLWHATTVTIAVAPLDSDEAKLLTAYADTLHQRRLDLRVRIVRVETLRQSAEALQARKVDLAVVRPDVFLPVDGLTVAVLREDAAIFIAPASANLSDVSELADHKLGVIVQHPADIAAITTLLQHFDLSPQRVPLVPLLPSEVGAALAGKRIDAVALFAAPGGAMVSALVKSLNKPADHKSGDHKLAVLGMSAASTISEEMPKFSEIEIPEGGLGGARQQPAEDVKTVGISYRLMARPDLDRATVASIAQTLFEMRSRLARVTPLANRMKAVDPDGATGAALPYHPGAIDYFAHEQKTFMERYADWIYILMFSGGGIASALAWIRQRMVKRRREMVDTLLDRLLALLTETRSAVAHTALDKIAAEVDSLVANAVRHARKRTAGPRTMSALILAIDSVRAAIMDRRIAVNSSTSPKPTTLLDGSLTGGAVPGRP